GKSTLRKSDCGFGLSPGAARTISGCHDLRISTVIFLLVFMSTQQTVRVTTALENQPLAVTAPVVSRSLGSDFARHAVIQTIANLGTLACSGALAFVLPRFLSVDDYGYFRLFLLYGSF